MKRILFIAMLSFTSLLAFSQNENDALRYSLINYNGTARFNSLSGAYGAIGGDFSALSQNPGGIGIYRKNEFSITPTFHASTTSSTFAGSTHDDSRNTLYLSNIGYVWASEPSTNGSVLKQFQFGIGVNQMASFSNRILIKGFNNNNSLLTAFRDDINYTGTWNEYESGLAFDADLMFYDTANSMYQVDMPGGGIEQYKSIESRGNTRETALSFGANFNDKFFIGTTFGFTDIKYIEEAVIQEKDSEELNSFFKSFKKTDNLRTVGSGFNMKLGFIYRPASFLRIGAAIHTPTAYYDMNDNWDAKIEANFDNNPTRIKNSPNGEFDYRMSTPMRAIGSMAIVLGQVGLISADYEYIDYSKSRIRSNDYDFMDENDIISATFGQAHNIRLGTEWKFGIYALRAGYAMYGSPYADAPELGKRNTYSLGMGIREKSYFIDIAYILKTLEDNFYLYNIAPVASNQYNSSSYSLTLGFRF